NKAVNATPISKSFFMSQLPPRQFRARPYEKLYLAPIEVRGFCATVERNQPDSLVGTRSNNALMKRRNPAETRACDAFPTWQANRVAQASTTVCLTRNGVV